MKRIYIAILLILPLFLGSCLKHDLEDLEAYHGTEITSIRGLYYYFDKGVSATGNKLFDWGNIARADVNIDAQAGTIVVGKATPAAANISQFDQTKVIMMLNISTAATIEPLDGSAPLGVEADWTAGKANRYLVTAADGSTKVWTITITQYVLN